MSKKNLCGCGCGLVEKEEVKEVKETYIITFNMIKKYTIKIEN